MIKIKLKDYIYDKERDIATIWIEEIDQKQLERLLQIFKAANPEPQNEFDYDDIIFGDEDG